MNDLTRSNSEETLNTLVATPYPTNPTNPTNNNDFSNPTSFNQDDLISIFTSKSEETLTNRPKFKIFNKPATSYIVLKQFPITSNFLNPGNQIFSSINLKNSSNPLLSIQSVMLSFLKKNSPIMIIHKFINNSENIDVNNNDDNTIKQQFCKVYFKILSNNLTCYVLKFPTLKKTLILLNNGLKSSIDLIWQNTKIRINGITGTSSTFGNGLIKIHLLTHDSPSLIDNIIDYDECEYTDDVKNFKINFKLPEKNQLFNALLNQDKSKVNKLINQEKKLIVNPFAALIDVGNEKINGMKIDAMTKILQSNVIDNNNNTNTNDITDDSLIIACILLILREQEIKKMRGNNKPSYV